MQMTTRGARLARRFAAGSAAVSRLDRDACGLSRFHPFFRL